MSGFEDLKDLFRRRLLAAAHRDPRGQTTTCGYEEELLRQRQLLDVILTPEIKLQRAVLPEDVQLLMVKKGAVPPEQQEWSPSMEQEDTKHFKEEQEELWSGQEGDLLQGLEEADTTKFPFISAPVQTEDDEEKPQYSQLHQRQTEQIETGADGEDWGEAEPERDSDLERHLRPETEVKTEDSNEDFKDSREHQSGLNSLRNSDRKKVFCAKSDQTLYNNHLMKTHRNNQTGGIPFSGSCENQLTQREGLGQHMEVQGGVHRGAKQEDTEPSLVKEEQEEVWISHAETTKFPFTPVCVKSEDDEEKPQSSELHQEQTEQIETEVDGEDCGGSEPDRDFNPDSHLQTVYLDETPHLSGSDTDDSGDWERSDEPQEGLNPLQNKDLPVSDMNCNTGNTSVSSSECATSFGQKEQLQKNKETNTGEKPFSCLVCGKRYQRKKPLNNHMIRHSVETPLSCSICKRSFIRKSEMVTHMRVHSGEKPFSCSVCGKMFSRHENLKRHYIVHTEEKLFGCSVCGKRFSQHGQLRRHSVVHTGEKPFGCSVCGERFALNENLKRHSICHSREKSFSCSVCKRSFIWRTEMVRHMRIHTGEKPFSCSVCGKRFTQSGDLKRHSLVHTGEKSFSCSVCGQKFTKSANLKRHSVVHTGEKPFGCSVCGKRFALSEHLRRHYCPHRLETI
ncbi:zinc finger protein 260 [Labrus bergylta]|uniref:zinc finger protein 260 n=1 Tax=Labrus bergylta TaxID=56723 RepID=UPI0033139C81